MRPLLLLPLVLFIVLAGYFATTLLSGKDQQALPSALLDKPAPGFALAGLEGGDGLSLEGLRGQVAVVNFFASWCAPCRVEHPVLMRLKAQGVPLYGIAYKDKPADSAAFLTQTGNPFRIVGVDQPGRVALDFGLYGVPETYVIDKAGIIRKRFVGPLTGPIVERELMPLLRALGAGS